MYSNILQILLLYKTGGGGGGGGGVSQQISLYETTGGMLLMCQNTIMWVYGAWIKTYYVLCPKTYIVTLEICHNQPLGRNKPLGAPVSVKLVYWIVWILFQIMVILNIRTVSVHTKLELDCKNTFSDDGRKPPFSVILRPLESQNLVNVAQKWINYERSPNKCTDQVWIGLHEYFVRWWSQTTIVSHFVATRVPKFGQCGPANQFCTPQISIGLGEYFLR